jgi:hypothetical protein
LESVMISDETRVHLISLKKKSGVPEMWSNLYSRMRSHSRANRASRNNSQLERPLRHAKTAAWGNSRKQDPDNIHVQQGAAPQHDNANPRTNHKQVCLQSFHWAIHPIVLTLPRLIIICFGRPGRTWLVADSTTKSQWKRRLEIACECRRPIAQTMEFELVSRWADLLIRVCSGIMLKIIF